MEFYKRVEWWWVWVGRVKNREKNEEIFVKYHYINLYKGTGWSKLKMAYFKERLLEINPFLKTYIVKEKNKKTLHSSNHSKTA